MNRSCTQLALQMLWLRDLTPSLERSCCLKSSEMAGHVEGVV